MLVLALAAAAVAAPATDVAAAGPTITVSQESDGYTVKGQGWSPGKTVYLDVYRNGDGWVQIATVTAGPATLLVPCNTGFCPAANPNAGIFTSFNYTYCNQPYTVFVRARAWTGQLHIAPTEAFAWGTTGCDFVK